MKAIERLVKSGLNRAEIAAGLGVSTQMVGMYSRFERFPRRKVFVCFVELAEARGITLLARDFIAANEACEPNGKNDEVGHG